jgi:hypothetical protein
MQRRIVEDQACGMVLKQQESVPYFGPNSTFLSELKRAVSL